MVQEVEKNVNEVRDRQNESDMKERAPNTKSLWKRIAERFFKVDPNYKTWSYVKGIGVYLALEIIIACFEVYFDEAILCQENRLEEFLDLAKDKASAIVNGPPNQYIQDMKPMFARIILEKELETFIKNTIPVAGIAAYLTIFWVFFNLFIFYYARSVVKHHGGQLITSGMKCYSLLAISMAFYFIYQSIGLPFAYGSIMNRANNMIKLAESEFKKLTLY